MLRQPQDSSFNWYQETSFATNALLGGTRNSAVALGAALAGVLVAAVGPGLTLLIDGLSFGFSAILVSCYSPSLRKDSAIRWDLRWAGRNSVVILGYGSSSCGSHRRSHGGRVWASQTVAKVMGGPRDWGFIASAHGIGTLLGGLLGMQLDLIRCMSRATACCFSPSYRCRQCLSPCGLWRWRPLSA